MKTVKIVLAFIIQKIVFCNASNDDVDANKELLKACMSPRGVDNVDDVKSALGKGADINVKDEESGQTPLMASVLRGKVNIVKHLLSVGADTTIGEKQGYTPPHGAAFQGRADVMKVLVDAGLDVNTYHDDGFLPLHRVCWGIEPRHVETFQVLLDHGIPHDVKSKDGKTCEDMTESDRIMRIIDKIEGREHEEDEDDDDDIFDDDYYGGYDDDDDDDDNNDAKKDEL